MKIKQKGAIIALFRLIHKKVGICLDTDFDEMLDDIADEEDDGFDPDEPAIATIAKMKGPTIEVEEGGNSFKEELEKESAVKPEPYDMGPDVELDKLEVKKDE